MTTVPELKKLVRKSGLTQAEFAVAVNKSTALVQSWLQAKRRIRPTIGELEEKVAKYLNNPRLEHIYGRVLLSTFRNSTEAAAFLGCSKSNISAIKNGKRYATNETTPVLLKRLEDVLRQMKKSLK